MRKYIIMNAKDVDSILFDKVLETSKDTLRYSKNSKRTFVKWEGRKPNFISKLKNTTGPLTHKEIKEILTYPEWQGEEEPAPVEFTTEEE